MALREDLVASAVKFLQDPNVASSPVENRIAFLQAKNLTQEEVNAALARASAAPGTTPAQPPPQAVSPYAQPQPYYGQYPPQPWQAPPPEVPRRDWRDWFIMATVVGGVSYGLYTLTKRYVYPLVAPPTPERLEQDKKSIDDQFEKAFALVDQLAKDTEALKASERERTERLDTALSELETVISDLKSANRRREDDAQRMRDDVRGLKDSLPKALEGQKTLTDNRLREVNTELKSLKTLISQRMNPNAAPAASSQYLRPSSGNATPGHSASTPALGTENEADGGSSEESKPSEASKYISSLGRSSPFSSGMPASKASIPAWQRAGSSSAADTTAGAASDGQQEVGSSSS